MEIRLLIVDDHPVVRSGLRAVLGADPQINVIGEAASGEEALTLASHSDPDVVLCDLRLGEGMNGIDATAALQKLDPPPAVLILSTYDRDAEILGAIEAGAAGYLVKDAPPSNIVEAIKQVAAGKMFFSPEIASKVMQSMRTPLPRLTDREVEVLQLLGTGASNKEMARSLFVTEATIKTHLVHIFTKLGVDSRSRAVHVARDAGLI